MTDNEAMQDSGVEWIGEVPREWQIDRLKDKTTLVVGGDWGDDPESDATGENVIVLRVADIQDRYFRFDNLTIRKIKPSSLISRLVNERSILIEKSGGGEKQLVGRAALPKGFSENAICSNFMAKIDFDYSVDVEYVNFIFSSLYFQNLNYPYIQQTTGIQNLNVTYYLASKVLFPPQKEQQAIAQYLDQRCGKLDAIIAIKQQQIKTLDALRQSIIYQAVTKGLDAPASLVDSGVEWFGLVPRGWRVNRAKLVANIFIPQRNKPELNDDFGFPWVTMENMSQPVISETENLVTVEAQQEAGSRILPKLSVIASCVGTFGVASINEVDVIINQQLQAYIPIGVDAYYLRYLITISKQYFEQVSSQTTIVYVNGEKFGNLPVLIPSRREQSEIVDFLSKETQRLDQLKTNLNLQISTLEAYKKSLIYECVTGKKRIALNQPNDEIALA